MKKIIIIFAVTLLLISCDKRKDFYYMENENAEFVIQNQLSNSHSYYSATINGNTIVDTVKLGNDYDFKLKIGKAEQFVKLTYSGNMLMKINGDDYTSPVDVTTKEWINFKLVPYTVGTFDLVLVFLDSYDKIQTINLRLVVFDNRTPVISNWILYSVGNLSTLHKKIVLTANDPDQIYGGGISYYQYIIGSDTTNHPSNELNYIFPAVGNYDIGIRCKDNNGAWSNFIQVSNFYISE